MTLAAHDGTALQAWPSRPGTTSSAIFERDAQRSAEFSEQQEVATMDVTVGRSRRALSKFRRAESFEFRLIFAAAFAVFFIAAAVEWLIPYRRFAHGAVAAPRKSVIARAKDAANTCAAYSFMG